MPVHELVETTIISVLSLVALAYWMLPMLYRQWMSSEQRWAWFGALVGCAALIFYHAFILYSLYRAPNVTPVNYTPPTAVRTWLI